MKVKPIVKISLEGFKEMNNPCSCNECGEYVCNPEYVVGFGDYPIGGIRNITKPFHKLAVGIECPKCFIKQCHHVSKEMYESYMLWKECYKVG